MKKIPRPFPAPLLLAPLLLAPGSRGEKPGFAPEKGTALVKRFQVESDLALEEMSLEVNDQDVSKMAGDIDMAMKASHTLAVTDVYEALAQGRPERLKRTFDEVSVATHVSASNPMAGDQDIDIPGSSELEGQSVVFTWSEDDGAYEVAFADGSDGEADLLESLTEDLDLRGFLPEKEVAKGDSWKIPAQAVRLALAPGGELKIEPDSEDERFAGMGSFDQFDLSDLVGNLDGEFSAEFEGVRDEDGVRVAVLKLELKGKSAQDLSDKVEELQANLPEGSPEMEMGAFDLEFEYEAEGELLWNLETGLPHSLELKGEVTMITDATMTIQMGDQEMRHEMSMTFGGSQEMTLKTGE